MKLKSEFGAADTAIFLCSVGLCLVIGIVFAFREKKGNTTINYFLANRNYKTLPVALSFVVTLQSSLTMLGLPAEVYAYGIGLAYFAIGTLAAYMFNAIIFVPVFHPLKLTSVYGYFKLRYGNNVLRYMTLIIGIIYNLFYMAIITVGTSVAIEVVLGIPFWGTILIYIVLTSIYTSLGGIKAVIWTDVFQLIVMVSGIIAVLVKSSTDAGGSAKVFEYSRDRLRTDFHIDPTIRYQFWNVSFGSFSTMLYLTLTQQAMQRIFSIPTVKAARTLFFICSPIYVILLVMTAFEGATVFAYFVDKGCDILEAGLVSNINAIIPVAILELFKHQPGLAGLFTASLSSAALSTLSSCLSSLSAVTYEDVIKVKFPNMHASKATKVSKYVVLLYGLITIVFAFAISKVPGSVTAIFTSFVACMDGPMCSIFLLSIMYRRATTKGLITGTLCGMALSFWLNIGSRFSDVPPYPRLPAGPTDQCYMFTDTSSIYRNISSTVSYIASFAENVTKFTALHTMPPTSVSDKERNHKLTALQMIYSISYVLFSLIGLLTSMIIGIIISLITKPPEEFDKRCLFSLRKHVFGAFSTDERRNEAIQNVEFDDNEINTVMQRDDAL